MHGAHEDAIRECAEARLKQFEHVQVVNIGHREGSVSDHGISKLDDVKLVFDIDGVKLF